MTNNITNIEEMFNETSTYQAYLDVEVALANAQAKQGLLPQKAAETIKKVIVIAQYANLKKKPIILHQIIVFSPILFLLRKSFLEKTM